MVFRENYISLIIDARRSSHSSIFSCHQMYKVINDGVMRRGRHIFQPQVSLSLSHPLCRARCHISATQLIAAEIRDGTRREVFVNTANYFTQTGRRGYASVAHNEESRAVRSSCHTLFLSVTIFQLVTLE